METAQGALRFHNGELECPIHYSLPRDAKPNSDWGGSQTSGYSERQDKTDWHCLKCNVSNFQRREECYRCGTSRDATPEEIALSMPTTSILLKNLILGVTEAKILEFIVNLTTLPIKSIKFQPDTIPGQKCCSIELHSVQEAERLHQTLSDSPNVLAIDGNPITFQYGPKPGTIPQPAAQHYAQLPVSGLPAAAQAALAAAQWNNLGTGAQVQKAPGSDPNLNKKMPAPNYTAFQYDATSGFYYDATTGYYYDSSSQYFYLPATQKYMYYDTTTETYIPVDSGATPTEAAKPEVVPAPPPPPPAEEKMTNPLAFMPPLAGTGKPSDPDNKTMSAKKLAKEMERWAKGQNQASQKTQRAISRPVQPISGFEVYDGEDDTVIKSLPVSSVPGSQEPTSEIDPFEIVAEEEAKMVDKVKRACLLCKRQFNTDAQMEKHLTISDLHKNNLRDLRRSLLSEEQLALFESAEEQNESAVSFRDRAKERREMYGLDDGVARKPKRNPPLPGAPATTTTTPNSSYLPNNIREQSDYSSSQVTPGVKPKACQGEGIGSRMLKAMGWTEGSGLGKSSQGMSDIIQVEHRRVGLGLGNSPGSAGVPLQGESYQAAVKRTAADRFRRMTQQEPL